MSFFNSNTVIINISMGVIGQYTQDRRTLKHKTKKGKRMIKPLFMLTAAASLVASTLVIAGENYNYSRITAGLAFGNTKMDDFTTKEDKSWYIQGAYELSFIPLIFETGYTHTSVNDDELPVNLKEYGNAYFIGTSLIISPTDRLDILPGIAVSRLSSTEREDLNKKKTELTAYTASLDVRFHLERGLWLTAGYDYREYDEEQLDPDNFFKIGAEYVVDSNWAIGVDYIADPDTSNTHLFARLFY